MNASGCVRGARGGLVEVELPGARVGAGIAIQTARGRVGATICALGNGLAFAAPHGPLDGIATGMRVQRDASVECMALGACLFGRAIDARGNPIDGGRQPQGRIVRITRAAPLPEERVAITRPFWTGVRAIDTLLCIGLGARVGIFGAPGIGKSTLLDTIVRGASAEAIVVALVGERGREAQAWVSACDARMTVICATSDRSAAERVRAADVAVAHANALRERGLDVLLILDSLARFAAAHRELAVATGESVGRGGYPPSVFARVAQLVESAGSTRDGTITFVASVLSDGDDRDPVSEAARSLLDGHIALSARLAGAGHFPAIELSQSASRTMPHVVSREHVDDAARVRAAVVLLDRAQELRSLGISPQDQPTIAAMAVEREIEALLRQESEPAPLEPSLESLASIADTLKGLHEYFN